MQSLKSINLNELGITRIVHQNSIVNIFILSIVVDKFMWNALNCSQDHQYLEHRVQEALLGTSRTAFFQAIGAVLKISRQRPCQA